MEVFPDYIALHPSRHRQVLASLQNMAPAFNSNGFHARVMFVDDPSGVRSRLAASLKGLFRDAGLQTNAGLGSRLMGETSEIRLSIACSRKTEPFGRTLAVALAPLIELPVMVTKRDEEMDLVIFIAGELAFTREGKALLVDGDMVAAPFIREGVGVIPDPFARDLEAAFARLKSKHPGHFVDLRWSQHPGLDQLGGAVKVMLDGARLAGSAKDAEYEEAPITPGLSVTYAPDEKAFADDFLRALGLYVHCNETALRDSGASDGTIAVYFRGHAYPRPNGSIDLRHY